VWSPSLSSPVFITNTVSSHELHESVLAASLLFADDTGDEHHWSVGVNYWWAGHNANIKGAFARISPTGSPSQNEVTVQLQLLFLTSRVAATLRSPSRQCGGDLFRAVLDTVVE
jgi:hypothetical protein